MLDEMNECMLDDKKKECINAGWNNEWWMNAGWNN